MKKRTKISSGENKLKTFIELEIEITGYCAPGYAPITHRAPEDCDPGDPGGVDDFHVYLRCKGKPDLEITDYLTDKQIETLKDELMEDHVDCFNYDNDAAYEASVGK